MKFEMKIEKTSKKEKITGILAMIFVIMSLIWYFFSNYGSYM